MFLDKAAKSFELLLGEAKTTSELEIIAYYDDEIIERRPPIVSNLLSNGTTAVTIVPSPKDNTKRTVREITIFNADTVQHAVTVRMKDGANTYRCFKHTMLPGSSYQYTQERGWFDPDISGSYAPIVSPAFTGTPTAPTAAIGTNNTQIATTAFVVNRTNIPGFMADRNNVNQTVSAGGNTKVQFNHVVRNDGNYFDGSVNYRFTPPSGVYYATISTGATTGTNNETPQALLYKNGALTISGLYLSPSCLGASIRFQSIGCGEIEMNGTDYLEGFHYSPVGQTVLNSAPIYTYFSAFRLRDL